MKIIHAVLFVCVYTLIGLSAVSPAYAQIHRGFDIPMLDLNELDHFHTVVAKDLDQPNQYLGHPTTVLLDDGKTMLAVFPTGHGRGEMRMMRSTDSGLTWKQLKNTGIKLSEVPTIFKVKRPDGQTRLVVTTCVPRKGTFQWTYSDDLGESWTPIKSKDIGLKNGIIVALASLWSVNDASGEPTGTLRGAFHDFKFDNYTIDLTMVKDSDATGGYRCEWSMAKRIDYATKAGLKRAHQAALCEPGVIRSPDGKTLAMLFRPQAKKTNAMISFSTDAGATFSDPIEMPGSLTGERHVGKYAPDGRLLICFRDYSPMHVGNPSHGDWVAWIGNWQDLVDGKQGQYRVRLKNNFGNSTNNGIGDCGYTGIEVLSDGTFICMTYGHWERNSQAPDHPNAKEGRGRAPYILATRFRLEQLDQLIKDKPDLIMKVGK